jgi:hypothetical protein
MDAGINLTPRQPANASLVERAASCKGSHERRSAPGKRLTHVASSAAAPGGPGALS